MPRVYPDKHYVIRRCIKLTLFHPHGFSRSSRRSGGGNLFLATARDQKSRYVYEVFSAPRAKRESNAGPSTEEHLVIDSISKQTWGGERERKKKKKKPATSTQVRAGRRVGWKIEIDAGNVAEIREVWGNKRGIPPVLFLFNITSRWRRYSNQARTISLSLSLSLSVSLWSHVRKMACALKRANRNKGGTAGPTTQKWWLVKSRTI